MAIDYKFQRGVDLPNWQWLPSFPAGASGAGTSCTYDGNRYIYYFVALAGTGITVLYQYDTWSGGWWQTVVNYPVNAAGGMDILYDRTRNVLWLTHGNSSTVWRFFNLNPTALVLMGQVSVNPYVISQAVTTALPVAAISGSSIAMADDTSFPTTESLTTGTAGTGSTTTTIVAATETFTPGLVGCQLRFTSGTNSGQKRIILSITNATTLVVSSAFGGSAAAADTWEIELPTDTTVSATSTTLVTTGGLTVNKYTNADCVITAGTGIGQRFRIASNTATTLTLAGAVAGNSRTGPWTVTPDATSVYRIVPSTDFLFYQVSTNMYRIDVARSTVVITAVTAPPTTAASGGHMLGPSRIAPFSVQLVKGQASNTSWLYDVGLDTWSAALPFYDVNPIGAGTSYALIPGRKKVFVYQPVAHMCAFWDQATGRVEGASSPPYMPGTATEGFRVCYVKTAQGVEWIYMMRPNGQEFFRLPLEWL